ncbi:uncharacterized protein LOC110718094 [Chenopodium quinoa]|uniref:uncharacterized protein LOC110718094 n=1 Tax=Chenopodium quinoa TaxID=63459 RepID=UPI000B7989F8|nr:uncharacterized protein LOC110718094 [Chenopodium quinoa]
MPKSLASMHKRPAGDIPQPASKALPGPPLAASPAKRTPAPARPTTAGKSLQLTPSASAGHTRMGSGSDAAGGDGTPQPEQDESTSRPDYNQYAKRMVKTLTRSEKEAVPAVHQVNLDRINSLLAEVNNPNDLYMSQTLFLPDE